MSGLVFNSLVCLVIAGGPAEALSQSRDQASIADRSPKQTSAVGRDASTPVEPFGLVTPFSLVKPGKDPLVVELGRSCLLRFPAGIRRTVLSNTDTSSVVQVGAKDLLVLGRNQGAANLTVWPASSQTMPSVIVVRVERQVRRDD